jgi:hypothetical protein
MTRLPRTLALAALLIATAACAEDPVTPGVPPGSVLLTAQEVFTLKNGWSGIETPTRTVISDDAAWAAAWAQIHAHATEVPPLPAIDFDNSVLVMAAMGTRPTGGYEVIIESVRAHNGGLLVSVLERSPGSSCGTYQALTAPIHVVQVPRSGTSGTFSVRQETYSC